MHCQYVIMVWKEFLFFFFFFWVFRHLFVNPWTIARHVSLLFTISWSFLKLMSIESVMPSNHLILCHPFLMCSVLPSIRFFYNKSAVHSNTWPILGQSSGASASASASVFPMNIQGWFPLGLTGLTPYYPRGFQQVFSSTTIWKHQFFSTQPSLWFKSHIRTWLLEKAWKWKWSRSIVSDSLGPRGL